MTGIPERLSGWVGSHRQLQPEDGKGSCVISNRDLAPEAPLDPADGALGVSGDPADGGLTQSTVDASFPDLAPELDDQAPGEILSDVNR